MQWSVQILPNGGFLSIETQLNGKNLRFCDSVVGLISNRLQWIHCNLGHTSFKVQKGFSSCHCCTKHYEIQNKHYTRNIFHNHYNEYKLGYSPLGNHHQVYFLSTLRKFLSFMSQDLFKIRFGPRVTSVFLRLHHSHNATQKR